MCCYGWWGESNKTRISRQAKKSNLNKFEYGFSREGGFLFVFPYDDDYYDYHSSNVRKFFSVEFNNNSNNKFFQFQLMCVMWSIETHFFFSFFFFFFFEYSFVVVCWIIFSYDWMWITLHSFTVTVFFILLNEWMKLECFIIIIIHRRWWWWWSFILFTEYFMEYFWAIQKFSLSLSLSLSLAFTYWLTRVYSFFFFLW